jgi:hypothetical protein
MIAFKTHDESLVITVYGEDTNPGWRALADEIIGSIQFE